jgi:hypothetical protein
MPTPRRLKRPRRAATLINLNDGFLNLNSISEIIKQEAQPAHTDWNGYHGSYSNHSSSKMKPAKPARLMIRTNANNKHTIPITDPAYQQILKWAKTNTCFVPETARESK